MLAVENPDRGDATLTTKKPAKKGGRTTAKKVPPAPLEPPKWNAGDMLAAKKTLVHTLDMCLDVEAADERLKAEAALEKAQSLARAYPDNLDLQQAAEVAQEIYDLKAAAAMDKTVRFVARALPREEYDELTSIPEMRPTIAQQEAWREKCEQEGIKHTRLAWNPDTFPPALIAQCLVEPEVTLEEAQVIWNEWSDAEAAVIFDLCKRTQKIVV